MPKVDRPSLKSTLNVPRVSNTRYADLIKCNYYIGVNTVRNFDVQMLYENLCTAIYAGPL